MWLSFHISEVTLAGPQDEDMNFQYYDSMLCIFCTLIGTLLCTGALSFCHRFVILSCVHRPLQKNKTLACYKSIKSISKFKIFELNPKKS